MDDAPALTDHLCPACESHFNQVQAGLQQLGVAHSVNKFMVRGLDYYCRTTFEFITADLGSQAAVGAGGRYDGLIESLGGPKNSPGIGFAMGMERLVLLLQQKEEEFAAKAEVDLFLAGIGDDGSHAGFALAHQLRASKVRVAMDHEGRSLKSQMKQANKAGARFVLILGDAELAAGKGLLRNMATEQQQEVALVAADIAARISGRGDRQYTVNELPDKI
jgi:histidyl-tRNA synthetase